MVRRTYVPATIVLWCERSPVAKHQEMDTVCPHGAGQIHEFWHLPEVQRLDDEIEPQQIDTMLGAQPAEKGKVLIKAIERAAASHDVVGLAAGGIDGNPTVLT